MKLINDGNFTGLAICGLLISGVMLIYVSVELVISDYFRMAIFSIGIATISAAGYAGRAKALKLKPFDNSYKKARESYKKDDSKSE